MAKHTRRKEERGAAREARAGRFFEAHHRWARMSASKVRLDADSVRGLPINDALQQLQFSNRRGAFLLNKVVRSALANAEYQISEDKLDLDVDKLYVANVSVGEGPYLKRWMTRARGMAYPILKHTCHISVTLAPQPAAEGDEGAADAGAAGRSKGAAGAMGSGSRSKKQKKQKKQMKSATAGVS
ncbi:50S ribosomal protein L22 [Planctomycetota bacterium]